MKTVRAIPAAYKQGWMPQADQFAASVEHSSLTGIISFELPSGAVVGLAAEPLRAFLNEIENRRRGQ